jgi:hypothetical protein
MSLEGKNNWNVRTSVVFPEKGCEMDHLGASNPVPLCPSAQPEMAGSVVFGVNEGTVEDPRIAYLAAPQPVTDEILALTSPVKPTNVLRFAAPCAGNGCQHFDGADCRLVQRTVRLLPPVVRALPPCRIRPNCRWWRQEGRAACLRCPQVVTETATSSEILHQVADPNG